MLFLVTTTYCLSADQIVKLATQRDEKIFRLNADQYFHYKFYWNSKNFEIIDPLNRRVESKDITAAAFYKAVLPPDFSFQFGNIQEDECKWIRGTVNYMMMGFAWNLSANGTLRLWTPSEYKFHKFLQMDLAKKYFIVPKYSIHWGFTRKSKSVITKSLVSIPVSCENFGYCTAVDQAALSPAYPWFTQELAEGNRDATVVYINGHVHCYQFATERGKLTDWRITQGTERNQWIPWNAGNEFEQKVNAYMHEIGLKFGRLDFIIGGKEPQFLEVNPCGQFGWLDDENMTLHNEIVDAILDPASAIQL